jgi:predicted ATPase
VFGYLFEEDRLSQYQPTIDVNEISNWVHIHIEEPELSLYPEAQCQLLEFIVERVTKAENDRQLSVMIATHSPYIINYLNLLLRRTNTEDKKGVSLRPTQLGVYKVTNGSLENLLGRDAITNEAVVNTLDLSETMNEIYTNYINLKL